MVRTATSFLDIGKFAIFILTKWKSERSNCKMPRKKKNYLLVGSNAKVEAFQVSRSLTYNDTEIQ